MIESIRIRNFKAFEDTSELSIRPITILVGPNSSGKSSVLQLLLALRQTADSRDMERDIVVNGDYVDLASFRDLVHNHDELLKVSVGITIKNPFPLPERTLPRYKLDARGRPQRVWPVMRDERTVEKFRLECNFCSRHQGKTIHVDDVSASFTFPANVHVVKRRLSKGAYSLTIETSGGEGEGKKGPFRAVRHAKFYDFSLQPRASGEVPRVKMEADTFLLPERLTRLLARQTETALKTIRYLGPLREAPQRLYWAAGESPQDVGLAGEDTLAVMWGTRNDRKGREIQEKLRMWMKAFNVASNVKIQEVELPFFHLLFTDANTGVLVNLADIGFGASQVLPLIVEGYYSPKGSLLITEQPEIHLHPHAQSTLADLLIDIAQNEKKLLVETHSEHLLYRLQRRIAEKKLPADDVAIYFFEPTAKGTAIRRIELDHLGRFVGNGLPAGFLDESYLESRAYSEETARRWSGGKQ